MPKNVKISRYPSEHLDHVSLCRSSVLLRLFFYLDGLDFPPLIERKVLELNPIGVIRKS